MYKYVSTWSYRGAKNTNTFVDYFESENSNINEVTLKIRCYLTIKYNWNNLNLSVTRQNINYTTI